jgi:hypothetical protein
MMNKNKKTIRKISATLRREKEIGGFEKEKVKKYIDKITQNGERKNSRAINAEILHEVNVLKAVRTNG